MEQDAKRTRRSLLLCLLPWGYCAAATARYGYDAPYWDQWWKTPLVAKAFEGTLRVGDFWTLINEHRVFFPNLITVPIARITHWDLRVELGLTFGFATLAFCIVIFLFRRSELHWPLPIAAVLFFSYSQHAVWMWSLHLMITMTLLCLVGVVYLLACAPVRMSTLAAAAGLAIVASYSFGAGIIAWPLGVLLLAMRNEVPQRALAILGWLGAASFTMIVYFIGYESTPANASAYAAARHPFQFLLYEFAYLGSPVAGFSPACAVVAGALGVLVAGWLAFRLFREAPAARIAARPFWGLILAGILVAVLTGLKQSQEGIAQAVSSRYTTWPTLYWVGLLGLVALRLRAEDDERGYWNRNALRGVSGAILLLATICSLYGTYRADERHDAFLVGREALLEGRTDEDLLFLYPDIAVPEEMREVLIQYELSIFRK